MWITRWIDSEEGEQIFKFTLSENDVISGNTLWYLRMWQFWGGT